MSDDFILKFKALKEEIRRDGITDDLLARGRAATRKVLAGETYSGVKVDPNNPGEVLAQMIGVRTGKILAIIKADLETLAKVDPTFAKIYREVVAEALR